MEKQKKIPVLRFPDFADDWQLKKIGTLTERVTNPVDVQDDKLYHQIGIRSHGKGIFYKEAVTGKSLGNKRVFWIKENAFIVNIVFAWEQAVAKTTGKEIGMIASHRFPMYSPVETQSDLDYLLHFFLTRKGKSLLELASPGGAGRNKTLGQKEFENLKFLVPNVAEQTKIASFITAIENKINQLKQKKNLLEQYKKGVMQKLFDNQKLKSVEFGEIAFLRKAKFNPENNSISHKCIELEHLDQGTGHLLGYVDSKNQKSQKNIFKKGDVLFGKLRPYLRKFWKAEFDGVCSSEIWVIQAKNSSCIIDYLFYLVQSQRFIQIANVSSGSKMPRADWNFVESNSINISSSIVEQTKIANFLSSIDEKINRTQNQIQQTGQYKKGLLQNMFV